MVHFRRQRLGDQLQVELAVLIQRDVRDPRVGFVTVTEVRMSSDLRHARVYVSIFGDDEQKEESLAALDRARGFLKVQIGKRLRLRHVPELRFTVDDTLDHAERIESLLEGTVDTTDLDRAGETESREEPTDG